MATIQSLPTELIRHTLGLAYPPGQEGSSHGLGRTCLVHSSWVGPSQSLMTQVVSFEGSSTESVLLFVEQGPALFSCESLSFSSCTESNVRAVLGKARPRGIKALEIEVSPKCPLNRVFNFASVQELSSLKLTVQRPESPHPQHQRLRFTSWPRGLRELAVDSPLLPAELFRPSQTTLTTLELTWPANLAGVHPASFATALSNVTKLTLHKVFRSMTALELSPEIVSLMGALPRLSHLSLTKLWPTQLEHFLSNTLQSSQTLSQLTTSLWDPSPTGTFLVEFNYWADARDRAQAEWEPALQRCIKLPALRGLHKWSITIERAPKHTRLRPRPGQSGDGETYERVAFPALEVAAAAAGIELVLGPVDG